MESLDNAPERALTWLSLELLASIIGSPYRENPEFMPVYVECDVVFYAARKARGLAYGATIRSLELFVRELSGAVCTTDGFFRHQKGFPS